MLCLTMIVKNAGTTFKDILRNNAKHIDRWCIVDTGSTDGTQDIIKEVLKDIPGELFEEPFINFKISRNNCLDYAKEHCKYIIMLDDTYEIQGNIQKFLKENVIPHDSLSILIKSDDTEYYSNRIIKSESKLRYKFTIHEVIDDKNNINLTIPNDISLFDHRSEYMEKRTKDRKQFDLDLLFKELEENPDDPRTIYYIAQTYGCMDNEIEKSIYFEKRIKLDGYIQEKIDAMFELARCYNFKLNQVDGKISEKQWKKCEDLYLQAWNLDKKRPDSLYFLGIHYYLEKNYKFAYDYFKLGFEIGYPIDSQYALKPTLSFYFLPKFFTEVCYYQQDHTLGYLAANLFLKNNYSNEVTNWEAIHKQLNKMPEINNSPTILKNSFVIVTENSWSNWTGKDILTKGVGGSETWVIETARNLNFNVIVFCNCEKSEMFENVGYNPINLFHNFIANNVVDYIIISRYTEYIPIALKGHAKKIGVIFHDILQPEIIIPINNKITLIGLTDWHCDSIKKYFPQFKTIKSNYGIKNFNLNNLKKKNSFIYSSFPNRGLSVLLKMWKNITDCLPDATLNVYCNLEQQWVNQVAPDEMKYIKENINQNGITLHGWVSKETLNLAYNKSEYWLYPCIFEETFCLTAMEAAINKTFTISVNLAGLSETIGDRGLIIQGDPQTEEWQNECIKKLKMLNQSFKESCIEQNYQWASERSWKQQTNKLINKLN